MARPRRRSSTRRAVRDHERSQGLWRKAGMASAMLVVTVAGASLLAWLRWGDPLGATGSEGRQDGYALYAEHCASCHGANREGQGHWRQTLPEGGYPAPPHDASGHTWHHPDAFLFETTKLGGQATAPPGFVSRMPGFADRLSDAEIRAVLDYIKSQWPARERRFQESVNQRATQAQ